MVQLIESDPIYAFTELYSAASQGATPISYQSGAAGGAVRAVASDDVSVAEIDPTTTFARIKIGTRAGSFVNQTRMFPSFKKSPRNGMIARTRIVSTSPRGLFIRSNPSTRSSRW